MSGHPVALIPPAASHPALPQAQLCTLRPRPVVLKRSLFCCAGQDPGGGGQHLAPRLSRLCQVTGAAGGSLSVLCSPIPCPSQSPPARSAHMLSTSPPFPRVAARGQSQYRGVTRHRHTGKWDARIGRVQGNKYLYLGTYDSAGGLTCVRALWGRGGGCCRHTEEGGAHYLRSGGQARPALLDVPAAHCGPCRGCGACLRPSMRQVQGPEGRFCGAAAGFASPLSALALLPPPASSACMEAFQAC